MTAGAAAAVSHYRTGAEQIPWASAALGNGRSGGKKLPNGFLSKWLLLNILGRRQTVLTGRFLNLGKEWNGLAPTWQSVLLGVCQWAWVSCCLLQPPAARRWCPLLLGPLLLEQEGHQVPRAGFQLATWNCPCWARGKLVAEQFGGCCQCKSASTQTVASLPPQGLLKHSKALFLRQVL